MIIIINVNINERILTLTALYYVIQTKSKNTYNALHDKHEHLTLEVDRR